MSNVTANAQSKRSSAYQKGSEKPFKLSRSKIELFLKCQRCFYFDRRLGIKAPPGFPFTLNIAVDTLLKREFDFHRGRKAIPPILKKFKIKSRPFAHAQLDQWRDSLHGGVGHHHKETNIIAFGGVDDLWVDPDGWLNVVDYKATSKNGKVGIDAEWQMGYKRQMEIYQWLFRRNGFNTADLGYFVYCNGRSDAEGFDGQLNFDVDVIPYFGSDDWVEDTIFLIKKCLESDEIPKSDSACEQCKYLDAVSVKLDQNKKRL